MSERVCQPFVPVGGATHGNALVYSYYASRAAFNHAHAEGVY